MSLSGEPTHLKLVTVGDFDPVFKLRATPRRP